MNPFRIVLPLLALLALCSWPALAVPVIDGRFSPAEGYTTGYFLNMNVENAGQTADKGQLWYYQDAASRDLCVALIQPLTLVDNTYGTNAIGWGKGIAPSGKNHNFGDLVGSDSARFRITDASQKVVFDFTLDYISSSRKAPSGFASLGATGGDGQVHSGSANNLLAWDTSLSYNFNTLGHVLTTNSPATNNLYQENPNYPGWVFAVCYEFKVSSNIFGAAGFGGITVPLIHDSPNKIGKNKVYTELDGKVPEPATVALLGLGGLSALLRKRRGRI